MFHNHHTVGVLDRCIILIGELQLKGGTIDRGSSFNQTYTCRQFHPQHTYESGVLETRLEAVGCFDQFHFVLVLVQSQQRARILLALRQTFDHSHVEPDVTFEIIHQPSNYVIYSTLAFHRTITKYLLELFKEVKIDVDLAVNLHRFADRLREKWLNVRDAVLRISSYCHVTLDGFAVSIPMHYYNQLNFRYLNETIESGVLGFDGGHHFGLVKGEVSGQIDGDFEFWQHVFGHLEMFGETLARNDGRNVPVAQNGLIRQLEFGSEDALFGENSVPLFDSVAFTVLPGRKKRKGNVAAVDMRK